MLRAFNWMVAVALLAVPAFGAGISGVVYDDAPALALRSHFVPLSGVTVRLYDEAGTLVATEKTDGHGRYTFNASNGVYRVAVDSKSIRSDAWPEQTFGPVGGQCARPDGTTVTLPVSGSCFGGRSMASDDAATLAGSEHVAQVNARQPQNDVDFGFSFNVVTSTSDAAATQGSLRQFVMNANALDGTNAMRFVPLQKLAENENWWTIRLASPLPELRDSGTIVDGTAYNYLSSDTTVDPNPGPLGEQVAQEKPELEVVATGATGIVCTVVCGVRNLALNGVPTGIVTRADAKLEGVMIGAHPDGTAVEGGDVGLQIERGTTTARQLFAAQQKSAGIAVVNSDAKLDGEQLDVVFCGTPQSGAGVALVSDGSSIRKSRIERNAGAGIVLGSLDGKQPARGNTVEMSTIASNTVGVVISPAASGNVIAQNEIMWNHAGGVVVAPFTTTIPQENRITANRYNENGGRPIALNLGAPADALAAASTTCEAVASAPNRGIAPPQIDAVRLVSDGDQHRVVVSGHACPSQTVEIYQSYVTSRVRDPRESKWIRRDKLEESRETLMLEKNEERALPSIGEFNYLGSTTANADGTFTATLPFDMPEKPTDRTSTYELGAIEVWHGDVLRPTGPADRAFAAVAIDGRGNTSEVSTRRMIDEKGM